MFLSSVENTMALQNQGEQSQLFHEGTSGTDIINSTNGQPRSLASDNDTPRDNEVHVHEALKIWNEA